MTLKKPQKSLKKWSKQKWRTKSGKPSGKTGERYLPEKAIKALKTGKGLEEKYSRKISVREAQEITRRIIERIKENK